MSNNEASIVSSFPSKSYILYNSVTTIFGSHIHIQFACLLTLEGIKSGLPVGILKLNIIKLKNTELKKNTEKIQSNFNFFWQNEI